MGRETQGTRHCSSAVLLDEMFRGQVFLSATELILGSVAWGCED